MLGVAPPAMALAEAVSPYTRDQTFGGALRYLRVDLSYEITEQNPEAGYVLFKYVPIGSDKATRGSIEVVAVQDEVRVFVRLPEMPSYHEDVLRDGLMRKLEREYGQPPPRDKGGEDDDGHDGDDSEDDGDEGAKKPEPPPATGGAPSPSKKRRHGRTRRR